MTESIQSLQDKLTLLRQIQNPAYRFIILMHNLEQMINERERKMKK